MSGNAWSPLVDLIRRNSDVDRPLRLAEVLDTAEWAASGPSFVTVRVAGVNRRAVYRDGPEPAIGSALQVALMGADTGALYLAWPLPVGGICGQVYVSARSLDDDSWAILRCDLGVGNVWQSIAAHPLGGGSYPRRPLRRMVRHNQSLPGSFGGFGYPDRMFTWGTQLDQTGAGPLYYSDDNGASWTSAGLDIVAMTEPTTGDGGRIYATDGADFYSSLDGASWSFAGAGPGGAVLDLDVDNGGTGFTIGAITAGGAYTAGYFLGAVAGWVGPWSPGAGGASGSYIEVDSLHSATYFDGADISTFDPQATPGAATFSDTRAGRFAPGGVHNFTLDYNPATEHPAALTGLLAGGWAEIDGSGGSIFFCTVIGLDDEDESAGHTRVIARSEGGDGTYAAIDARHVADLGANYWPSPDGVSH